MSTTAIVLCILLAFCAGGVFFSLFSDHAKDNAGLAGVFFILFLIIAVTRFFVLL